MHPEMLALALESHLIQHFGYVQTDVRLANESFVGGNRSDKEYDCYPLYMAIKKKKGK